MNIVQYNLTTTTKEGGVETFVWELSRHLARRGHTVTIIGGAGTISRCVPAVRVLRFPFVERMTWRAFKPFRRHVELTKLLERMSLMPAAVPNALALQPDLLHLHKPYDFVVGPLAHAAGAKVIYHGHGEDFYPFDQPLSQTADAMLSCSGHNASTLKARYHREPEVVFNGFDAELFSPSCSMQTSGAIGSRPTSAVSCLWADSSRGKAFNTRSRHYACWCPSVSSAC